MLTGAGCGGSSDAERYCEEDLGRTGWIGDELKTLTDSCVDRVGDAGKLKDPDLQQRARDSAGAASRKRIQEEIARTRSVAADAVKCDGDGPAGPGDRLDCRITQDGKDAQFVVDASKEPDGALTVKINGPVG